MLWTVAVGILLMHAALLEPPSWENAQSMGCDVKQIRDYSGNRWFVHVWVEFPDHRWAPKEAYAIRDGNERSAALADCDHWLKAVQKEQLERLKKERKQ